MIMTQDKARKSAARQRMAETGEPYSVARHATAAHQPDTATGQPDTTADHQPDTPTAGQILVRHRLSRTFELEVHEDVWAKADNKTRARLIAESGGNGSLHPGTTLAELIAHDLDEHGAEATTAPAGRGWEEEYYADGAASEGITVAEFKARVAPGLARERAREQAGQAQERADQAQGRADQAQEQAELAQERADDVRGLADEAQDLADEAREAADEAREDAGQEEQERADREADQAQQRADRAMERASREQERADRAQKRADLEQERADLEQERAGAAPGGARHHPAGMPRPPRPPVLPRLPRPPRLPRLPRLPR